MKTSTETTTPAGLVSRESVRELIKGMQEHDVGNDYQEGYNAALRTVLFHVTALPSAELPAIGVSDAQVEAAARAMVTAWCYAREGSPDWNAEWRRKCEQYRKQARAALEAALRPTGEDRG